MLHKQYVFHRYYHSLQSCYCWIEYIETLYLKCNIHYIIAHEKKKPIAMLRFYIEWEPQTCIRYTLYVTRMYLQSNSNFAKKIKCKININNAFISCLSWLTQRPESHPPLPLCDSYSPLIKKKNYARLHRVPNFHLY